MYMRISKKPQLPRGCDMYIHVYVCTCMYLLLPLSHGQKLEPVSTIPHTISQLAQVSSRVRTRTQDEHNWRLRR